MLVPNLGKASREPSFHTQGAEILGEVRSALMGLSEAEVENAKQHLLSARRIFFAGAGRSRLALEMGAMRMMHLGLAVHVSGEVVTPAIESGDLLVVASGSGTTAGPVRAAQTAKEVGATVLAITAAHTSELASFADALVVVPAATKHLHDHPVSIQYGGSLFEQTVLLLMDTLFQGMWRERGESATALWKRHANLE